MIISYNYIRRGKWNHINVHIEPQKEEKEQKIKTGTKNKENKQKMITNMVDESNYIDNHFEHQQPKRISQIDTNPTVSAFTLNANGLNAQIKILRLSE